MRKLTFLFLLLALGFTGAAEEIGQTAPAAAATERCQTAATTPEPLFTASLFECTVTNDCGACESIKCTSTPGDCHSGTNWVECDGNRTYCQPEFECTGDCTAFATCFNAGGGKLSCTGTGNDCYAIDDCYVACDGVITECPDPPYVCPFPY